MPTNRNFGITFGVFFLLISLYIQINYKNLNIYTFSACLIFFVLGFLNSKILKPLNFLWFKFGLILGYIVSPIIMGFVYFAIVTPTGLIMKILKKNLLNLNKENKSTYWIKREKKKINFNKQF